MLENPRVTNKRFPPAETHLEGATVIGRCSVKGRVGECIGLLMVDEDDNRFVVYAFNDRFVTIPESGWDDVVRDAMTARGDDYFDREEEEPKSDGHEEKAPAKKEEVTKKTTVEKK